MAVETCGLVYMNGRIVPLDEARIHVLSVGFTYATTVFEGLRAYWDDSREELHVFRLHDHVQRLLRSIKLMRMQSEWTADQLADSVLELLRANELRQDAHIRQLAYADEIGPIGTSGPVSLTVAAMPSYRLFDTAKGVACCCSSWRRISDEVLPPRIKCTANYQNGRHAFLQAKLDGYDNPILLNERGKVAEGPTMCLFLVRDGRVFTPALTSGVLESITRDTVIRLFRECLGIEVEEREVDRTELYLADEAFFCGTACEVLPITSIDRHIIGSGHTGELTRAMQERYGAVVRGTVFDHSEWRTPVYSRQEARR